MIQQDIPQDGIVLLDGSARSELKTNFAWDTYNSSSFSSLDLSLLRAEISELETIRQIISQPNIWTIPQVTAEFYGLLEHINQKIRCLSLKKIKNKRTKVYLQEHEGHKDYLEEVQHKAWRTYQALKSKEIQKNPELNINKNSLDILIDMVVLVSQNLKLKNQTGYYYGRGDSNKPEGGRDTDERLVATLLYLSMFHDQKPSILTGDGDLLNLLGVVPKFLGAIHFYPDNKRFARTVARQNAPRAYFLDGDINLVSEGSVSLNHYPPNPSRLHSYKREQMMKELGRLWWGFSDSLNGKA